METLEVKRDQIKEYYGKILNETKDLKSNACCSEETIPSYIKDILKNIDDEILNKFYGCGSPIPESLEGCVVLDLGCGSGRDAYILSKLVGPKGKVIGVDMTDEQIDIAKLHIDSQMKKFGYQEPNIIFKKGYIENLNEIGIEDQSVDVVVSNCVINLSPDKYSVFSEIFRVLKPGGELYFSDVFSGQRIPEYLKTDPVLFGECLSGALYIEDFRRLLRKVGCLDYRVVSNKKLSINNQDIEEKIGMIDFYSITIRAFKISHLEDICEDYGQIATYLGTLAHSPHQFALDRDHIFKKGKPQLVCGNTASMLQDSRFAKHFEVFGDRNIHFGPFDCSSIQGDEAEYTSNQGSCC